jgi:hypothetical protein
MYAEYQDGATLAEVGAKHGGITRERVRQLFGKAELETRTGANGGARRREANTKRIREHQTLIVEQLRQTKDLENISVQHNVPMSTIKEILKEALPAQEYLELTRKPPPKTYIDRELLDFLRQASATSTEPLTRAFYNEYASGRLAPNGKPWPTTQTYSARFGSWADALRAAGVRAKPTPTWTGKRIDREECLAAIRTVTETLGRAPTCREYEIYARKSDGSLPSTRTVLKRCGTWYEALGMAEA